MNLITDVAKDVVGYEGIYAVTRNGVVYSLPRKGVKKLKALKPVANMKTAYLRVALSKEKRNELVYIHRIVAEAYIPNPLNKPMVNHRNGIKTDNRVENLEWVTGQENRDHAFEIGLYPNQKIPSYRKQEVMDLVDQRIPIKTIADKYGMKPRGIASLILRYRRAELRLAA